jgi:hypothetical protein
MLAIMGVPSHGTRHEVEKWDRFEPWDNQAIYGQSESKKVTRRDNGKLRRVKNRKPSPFRPASGTRGTSGQAPHVSPARGRNKKPHRWDEAGSRPRCRTLRCGAKTNRTLHADRGAMAGIFTSETVSVRTHGNMCTNTARGPPWLNPASNSATSSQARLSRDISSSGLPGANYERG